MEQVELRGVGLLDEVVAVELCVTNPNDRELDFRRVEVAVDVEGSHLAEGASETPVRLARARRRLSPSRW